MHRALERKKGIRPKVRLKNVKLDLVLFVDLLSHSMNKKQIIEINHNWFSSDRVE